MGWDSAQNAAEASNAPLRRMAQRYALKQLTFEEARDFAEHCAECPSCAAVAREVIAALARRSHDAANRRAG